MYLSIGSAFDWFTTLSDDVKSNFELLTTQFIQRFGRKIDKVQTLAVTPNEAKVKTNC